MFERIVDRELPRHAARRACYTLLAATLPAAAAAGVMFAASQPTVPPAPEPGPIEIRFAPARSAGRRTFASAVPHAARPPGAARGPAGGRGLARAGPTPAPTALLQPRVVPASLPMPGPGEVGDGLPAAAFDDDEGVVGGGSWEEAAASAGAAASAIEEAPQWYAAGFRRPAEVDAGCFARTLRLPAELGGLAAGRLTVRFAVGRDGAVREVLVLSPVPDRRVAAAIEAALRACRFRPGTDAQGRPVGMWVILPLRFEAG